MKESQSERHLIKKKWNISAMSWNKTEASYEQEKK